MRRCFLSIAVVSIALSSGGAARAQNAADQAEARTLFSEGARLLAGGQYAEACSKLEASYHLYAGIGTRGKLAECYEKVGRTASAWAMYEEVAALAGKSGDAVRQRIASERAAALEPRLSHLSIVLPGASDVPGLVIKRGGEPVERGALGAPMAVDPGAQSFELSAPGRVSTTVDVPVGAGQSVTFTVPGLELAPEAPAATASSAPSGASSGSAPDEAPHRHAWLRTTGIAIGGAGVVAAAVGSILALTARSSYDGAFDSGACMRPALGCNATGQHQTDSARSQANAGGVVLGVGAAMVIAGIVLFVEGRPVSPKPVAWQFMPELGPSTARLSLRGAF
jgi:hypothetical protein